MMQGINSVIYKGIKNHLLNYNIDCSLAEQFLESESGSKTRQGMAQQIIHNAMETHQKEGLLPTISELSRVEIGTRELYPHSRDHVSHAVLTFLLGIFLQETLPKDRQARPYPSPIQWKIAAFFHDIAYPLQIAMKLTQDFFRQVNNMCRTISTNPRTIIPKITIKNLEKLENGCNALDLIQTCIDRWKLQVEVKEEYKDMVQRDEIDHGIVSSLVILKVIDHMYQVNNPQRLEKDIYVPSTRVNFNQQYFNNDIIPACSAVFIHNLKGDSLGAAKIEYQTTPLAFLLKLSDCFQEWERPSKENPTGISASQFDINVADSKVIFTIPTAELKEKVRSNIDSVLNAPFIEVITKQY